MRIGYACLALGVPGSGIKTCTLKNATQERLLALIRHNLDALDTLIDYNIKNGIKLFRISSDLIPFGSSAARRLPWQEVYAEKLLLIGDKIKKAGMRVSMHPGQYTVLNSPDESVAQRAAEDLEYHAEVLDGLNLGPECKIILHTGGVYGDKQQAMARFISRFSNLNPSIQRRLVLENDDKLFNIKNVLCTAESAGIPAVFDTLHHAVNPADSSLSELDWIRECSKTWGVLDGPQKIHYSQQHPGKKPGAHSGSIRIDEFRVFYEQLSGMDPDIMLEVKDKNLSALKCIHCMQNGSIKLLEAEWARYKYSVLEHTPGHYYAIRELLKDKEAYPALEMYRLIEASLETPVDKGTAVNAAQHVWGYFNDRASEMEKRRFQTALRKFVSNTAELQPVKNLLESLANKYQENYLLNGYYFYL